MLLSFLLVAGGSSFGAGAADSGKSGVRILFSGEVQGGFEPCGCAGGPTGGLSRRLGYRDAVRKDWSGPLYEIDAGNYLAAPGPNGEAINQLMLKSLGRIPISVLNLGVGDLYWWPVLSKLDQKQTRIISTNLVPARPGEPTPERFAVLDIPLTGGPKPSLRLAFLGLVDPSRVKPNSGFRALDPLEAVQQVKPEVLKQADALVVLWDLIRPLGTIPLNSPIHQLAAANPEICLIITTERRDILYDPQKVGNATLLSGIERGRYMGDLRLEVDEEGHVSVVDPKFVELKNGSPEDPEMLEEQESLAARLP